MCGLTGWFFPKNNPMAPYIAEEIFRGLAYKTQFRGIQSFGIFYINSKNKETMVKGIGPYTQWAAKNDKTIKEIVKSRVVMVHTRLASRGDVTINNCHPFEIGDYICAHNGNVSNYMELAKTLTIHIPVGETDSEAVFCYLAENGFNKTSYEEISGWFNFSVYNSRLNNFKLIASKELFYLEHEDGIIYQSEDEPIAAVKHILYGFDTKIDHWKIGGKELKISSDGTKKIEDVESKREIVKGYNYSQYNESSLFNKGY